jgi:dihydroxyacetone kinase-like protein
MSTPMSSAAITPAARITSATDRASEELVHAWLLIGADRIIAASAELTELDARIGDGDHGINLGRGMTAVRVRLLDAGVGPPADLLRMAGRLLVSTVGGASGPLYGTLFLDTGLALADAPGTALDLADALTAGVSGVGRRGRSTTGQKTMLDTLVPAMETLRAELRAGRDLVQATTRSAEAASAGCEATRGMVAQRGRASYLGDRAIGHLDPGAVSSLLLIEALAMAAAQPPASTPTDTRR